MEQRIKNLIQLLEEKTRSNDAMWTRTSSDNEFKIDINNSTITVDMWNVEAVTYYEFVILNENGDRVERIVVGDDDPFNSEFQIVTNFYDAVRNSYFKVDETIENILKELNSSNKIGINRKK
ncbi:hypothetical protein [Chryseobacterium taeanense]|uniref:hypothetical protein n=1 Tax=Chryseobacterium taeanense TaxID=311334 RepID=UPI0035B0BC6F